MKSAYATWAVANKEHLKWVGSLNDDKRFAHEASCKACLEGRDILRELLRSAPSIRGLGEFDRQEKPKTKAASGGE